MIETEQPASDYRLEDQVGFVLRKAQQRHVAIFAERIPDLTPSQFAALAKLGERGEASQNQLGQMIAMDAATIKGVIDRLRARGLVAHSPDAGDRRRIVVRLTEEGRAMLDRLLPVAAAVTAETLGGLNQRQASTLLKLLGRIS